MILEYLRNSGVGRIVLNTAKGLMKNNYEVVILGGSAGNKGKVQVTDDWQGMKIYNVKNYGNQHILRNVLGGERPDLIMMITDPRYWVWLWMMEDEIRCNIPLVYYNLWDDSNAPFYNKDYYKSNDSLLQINKQTNKFIYDILKDDKEIELNMSDEVKTMIENANPNAGLMV